MKKVLFLLLITIVSVGLILPGQTLAAAKKPAPATPAMIAKELPGRLALQVDSENKLWYITPITKQRWYLHSDDDLKLLIDTLGVTPTVGEFSQLAKNKKTKTPASLIKKYSGKILVSPTDSKVFYLNPPDNIIYEIKNFKNFYSEIGKAIAKQVNGDSLRFLAMNASQKTYDPAFYGIASVRYDGANFSAGQNSDRVLPLASLSKLMTALIFMDTNPDWDKEITITPEEIRYPCTLQACGTTSEIDLHVGDKIKIYDLWVAMLSASSNQSSAILADNSGLSREEFIKKMNEKATSTLGLVKTKFVEMSGLSPDNISTAKEFAKVAKLAFESPWISDATKTTNHVFWVEQADGTLREVKVLNRNYSLLAISPGASKSGYLVEAQRNAVVEKEGQIAVALHCYSLAQRNSVIRNLFSEELSMAR